MAGIRMKKTGEWAKVRRALKIGNGQIKKALRQVMISEANLYRKQMVRGITSQAPGGKRFTPLAKSTKSFRRAAGFKGTKALVRSGELRKSITVVKVGQMKAFVGVKRAATGSDGRSLVRIAEIHEYGTRPVVRRITPKMAAFFAATGKASKSRGGRKSTGILITRIPPRPFIGPVLKVYGRGSLAKQRIEAKINANLVKAGL